MALGPEERGIGAKVDWFTFKRSLQKHRGEQQSHGKKKNTGFISFYLFIYLWESGLFIFQTIQETLKRESQKYFTRNKIKMHDIIFLYSLLKTQFWLSVKIIDAIILPNRET